MKYQAISKIEIEKPLKEIYDFVKDFNNWPTWSPWSTLEPDHKGSNEGEPGKTGHTMNWEGKYIGSGMQKISDMTENSIMYDLEFFSPHKAKAEVRFEFKKTSEGTEVTWIMDGNIPFFIFFLKNKMKAWIEMDFDRGLKMLKHVLEVGEIKAKSTIEGIKDFEGFNYFGLEFTSNLENIANDMTKGFDSIMSELEKHNKKAKHWGAIYTKMHMVEKAFSYITAASTEELEETEIDPKFLKGQIEAGKMLEIKHHGSYKFLGNAWSMGSMYLRAMKIKQTAKPFEYYWNNPANTEEDKLETSIFFPVKEK